MQICFSKFSKVKVKVKVHKKIEFPSFLWASFQVYVFLCSAPVIALCYKTGCVAWFPAIKSRCKYKTEKSLALRISTLPHLLPAIKLKIETNCQTFSFFLKIVKKRIQLFRKEFLNWSFCIWLYMRLRVILILLKFTLHKTFYRVSQKKRSFVFKGS